MEAQLHRTHDPHSYESLDPAAIKGSEVYEELERGHETKSKMRKVKEKVEKLKATIKQGHDHHDDSETVDDSPAVRCGLVEPTVMEKPVLVEDLYATHSDIVDPPVRSFAQWEEEERRGVPPPLSTGICGTQLTNPTSHVGHPGYGQDIDREREPQKGNIGKVTVLEENPITPNPTMDVSPATHQSKVTDLTNTGGMQTGITDILRSFDKMKVYERPESKPLKSDQKEPAEYTGSHDQFAPEPVHKPTEYTGSHDQLAPKPVQNPPPDTIAGKTATAKDMIASKLTSSGENKSTTTVGEEKPNKKSSFTTDYAHIVAETLSGTLGPVYERVVGGGTSAMSRIRGTGSEENTTTKIIREPESKGVGVKEYLVETFKPGDDDKVLSEVITQAFHRRKPPEETDTSTLVVEKAERFEVV